MHPGIQRQGPWLEGWIAGHDVAESSRASELDGGVVRPKNPEGNLPGSIMVHNSAGLRLKASRVKCSQ